LVREKEKAMARQAQSVSGLSIDRRQLLASAAAVTAAGTVPNAEAVGTTNSVQAATEATIPALECLRRDRSENSGNCRTKYNSSESQIATPVDSKRTAPDENGG
jgi:hypothetical protein